MDNCSLLEWSALLDISLIVSTYWGNQVFVIADGKLSKVGSDRPKGIYYKSPWLKIATWNNIWTFREYTSVDITSQISGEHDTVFLPKKFEETGDIGSREIAGESIAASKLSCLVTLDDYYSVRPIWKPKWIDRVVAEDRCHVNGIALDKNFGLGYVTALGINNKKDGWRTEPAGGCVIDAKTGLVIVDNLRMPHSPRLYQEQLWVCDSMRGELSIIDVKTKKRHPFVKFPEFVRGLAFWGDRAIVGLSQMRYTKLGWAAGPGQCGLAAVNLNTAKIEAILPLDANEVFDVQVLPGKKPIVIDPRSSVLNTLLVLPESHNLNQHKKGALTR